LTYSTTGIPTLDSSSKTVTPVNGEITITGSNFGLNAKAYIGDYLQTTVSSTSSQIKIKLSKMDDHESFSLKIRTDSVNLPTVTVAQPLFLQMFSVSPNVGSSGGEKITISTFAIGLGVSSDFKLYYGSGTSAISVCETIEQIDSSTLVCMTKKGVEVPTNTLNFSFTHRSSQTGKTSTITLA
jgi:hypothetical protein